MFSICFFRWLVDFEAYSHWSQGYLTPPCLYLIWLLRLPVVVAAYSHWSHKYLTPSCLFLICFLRIIVVVAVYSTLITLIPHSFMYVFNMSLQRSCRSCSVFTVFTGISNSFVFIFKMFLKLTCCSGSICTLPTGISYPFMFIFNMVLQTTCGISSEFTRISLLHVYFQYVSWDLQLGLPSSSEKELRNQYRVIHTILECKKFTEKERRKIQKTEPKTSEPKKRFLSKTVYDEVSKRHFVHKIFKKLHIDKDKYYAPMEIPGVKLEQMIFTIKKMRRKLEF